MANIFFSKQVVPFVILTLLLGAPAFPSENIPEPGVESISDTIPGSIPGSINDTPENDLSSHLPRVKNWNIEGCTEGKAIVLSFPFARPEFRLKYEISVFSEGRKTSHELVNYLRKKGFRLIALVNAGYFDLAQTSGIYSYYRSQFTNKAWPHNSSVAPRACMIWNRKTNAFTLLQSTDENYQLFQLLEDVEIWCAGPQLMKEGKNVAEKQYCIEKFQQKCRSDGQDSGIAFYSSAPRTGSCYTVEGELKLFSLNSSVERCGGSVKELAQIMAQEGCYSGMNHDGGGSSSLFTNISTTHNSFSPAQHLRKVPVWIGIFEKNSTSLSVE